MNRESAGMGANKAVTAIHFRGLSRRAARGVLVVGSMSFPAACGGSGRGHIKREGDGLSPIGTFRLEGLLYRRDRMFRPRTGLPARPLRDGWAWCERVGDRNYNRLVAVAPNAGHDVLKRADHLYDVIVVTAHNARPRVQNHGSAIFFHLARDGFAPTAGCIAVTAKAMREILQHCDRNTRLVIY
jgi:L,D-peptidoglycan transpeptidase YkuD (ErfK/YbiS/YcfS/YnhG family)